MKPIVGILLDRYLLAGVRKGRTQFEQISYYNKAAEKLNVTPFYMSLQHIKNGMVRGLLPSRRGYRSIEMNIPPVVHNRAYLDPYVHKQKMLRLKTHSILFNERTRYSKLGIHGLLEANSVTNQYLPHTLPYSKDDLVSFMERFNAIYIKPCLGGQGDGIVKLSRASQQKWKIQQHGAKKRLQTPTKAISYIHQYITGTGKPHLIQEAIPLAVYNGRPFDFRVTIQRGLNGEWQVSGIVGKVACVGKHVTNVSKGGALMPYRLLLGHLGGDVIDLDDALRKAGLEIAQYLGEKLPGLCDVGLDMGMDQSGEIKFIEMNARDQRLYDIKALRSIKGLRHMRYRTYATPMEYAKFLLSGK